MNAAPSRCYVNRTGFEDDTSYVEVFADGHTVIHTRTGQQITTACAFERPIASGEWVEIENPAARPGGAP